jgi:DNA (cytosine-5)-methyltransferase 1
MSIPVIDLFAGPGGLGEGFSSLTQDDGSRAFKIKLSIEKDEHAHRTLELRAFLREFPPGEAPAEYYDYLSGAITREVLFSRHREAARRVAAEAWLATLGKEDVPHKLVDERIRQALGNRANWVLIGGPPCQAYSLVGRSRIIGKEGVEYYDEDPRHHLYEHYLRIIAEHRPPVFVMENVKGLLSARVQKQRIFERILGDLRQPLTAVSLAGKQDGKAPLEYRLVPLAADRGDLLGEGAPQDFVLRAEDYGVPQARHRVIILGIRSDRNVQPGFLKAVSDPITTQDVIGDLPRLRSGLSKEEDTAQSWRKAVREVAEASWLNDEKIPKKVRDAIESGICHVHADLERGANFQSAIAIPARHLAWYYDTRLNGVCNHESRAHIRLDLHRYFFAAVFARKMGRSPLLEDFPQALLPKHENVAAALKETKFNDRFRVQLAGRPSTTVVSHISKDGHYYIHYDPTQCRSLTVREAARLQTFPDNYFFEGPRTEQYQQVGNAVPPLLAKQIAEIVTKLFD